MKTIQEYKLLTISIQERRLPEGAEILCVTGRGGEPYLCALVDTDAKLTPRTFEMFGAGHIVPTEGHTRRYIGVFTDGEDNNWHTFEYLRGE